MAFNIQDIAITSLETITAYKYGTGDPWFILDELQSATIEQSEDRTEITGKQGRRLATLRRNKAVTVSGENGLVSSGLLEAQTGGTFRATTSSDKVRQIDYLTIDATTHKAVTQFEATGTAGAEIVALYVKDANGVASTKLEQDDAAAAGKFAYNPATKELTFANTQTGEIVVVYDRAVTGFVLANESGALSGSAVLYIDAIGEDTCNHIFHVQIFCPRADVYGDYSMDMGDNQTMHSFQADVLSSGCLGGNFFTWTIFSDPVEQAGD